MFTVGVVAFPGVHKYVKVVPDGPVAVAVTDPVGWPQVAGVAVAVTVGLHPVLIGMFELDAAVRFTVPAAPLKLVIIKL
ncbi:hypothetical protein D3C86_1616620 [compost metagenome]